MALLFIDSTYDISVGLLDEKFSWIDLRHHAGQKASTILQVETHLLCKQHKIKLKELKGIISVAGPGFYTGLRLSEGFADIFKVFNVPSYTFYSYEIPKFCENETGIWMTKAYRGEYFIHSWGKEAKNELLPAKELGPRLEGIEHVFIHSKSALDEAGLTHVKAFTSTCDLIKEHPTNIFSKVVSSDIHRESFYFRAPEDEFRMGP